MKDIRKLEIIVIIPGDIEVLRIAYVIEGYNKVFPSKKVMFFRDCNVSSIKRYISVVTLRKKWIETIKYSTCWWYPFCTTLKLNKSHLNFLLKRLILLDDLSVLCQLYFTLHKKRNLPLRISSVNVTKFAGNCGFGHIYWRNT